jgi:hypothetical protein
VNYHVKDDDESRPGAVTARKDANFGKPANCDSGSTKNIANFSANFEVSLA